MSKRRRLVNVTDKGVYRLVYSLRKGKKTQETPKKSSSIVDLGVYEIFDCVHEVGCLLEHCNCGRMNPAESTATDDQVAVPIGTPDRLINNIIGGSTRITTNPNYSGGSYKA